MTSKIWGNMEHIDFVEMDSVLSGKYCFNFFADLLPTVFSILVPKRHADGVFHSVGTSFVCVKAGESYLVSAAHVIRQIYDNELERTAFIILEGKAVPFRDFKFCVSDEHDIAVAKLEDALNEFNSDTVTSLKVGVPLDCYENIKSLINCGLIIGYPASQANTVELRGSKSSRKVQCISGVGVKDRLDSPSRIKYPVVFHYDGKNIFDQDGRKKNASKIEGLSGGPAFLLVEAVRNDNSPCVNAVFVGVFVEWHKKYHELIVSSKDALSRIIEQTFEE